MFALLDRQSFVRADGSVATDASAAAAPVTDGRDPALSSVLRAIPAARSSRAVPGALFTPAEGIPAAPAEDLSVLVVAGDGRRDAVVASLTVDGVGTLVGVGSYGDAREHMDAGSPCDLAVVDLGLPGGRAVELLRELRDRGWRTVVLGGPDDPEDARDAFQAGALALLMTTAPSSGPSSAPRPAPAVNSSTAAGGLSPREVQVLQSVADGRTNAQIGDDLGLSALTVKSHLSRIGRKLGTGDRAGMVAVAMRAYLVH